LKQYRTGQAAGLGNCTLQSSNWRIKQMRKLLVFILLVGLCATGSTYSQEKKKSLYERLGGEAAISAVVDDFAQRVLADQRINQKFAKSNAPRLLFFLKQQICAATGGPCKYEGRDMLTAHKNMGITNGEFNALVEDLVATLNKFNVPKAEQDELLSMLAPMKSQIVEVQSDATGTPLPANFKPAPPLPDKKIKQGPFRKRRAKRR
jgi:hemoglobin